MSESFRQSEEPKKNFLGLMKALQVEFGIEKRSDWDPEYAAAAAESLIQEEKGKSPEQIRTILLRRFIDAFYPAKDHPQSVLWEETATAPIELSGFQFELLSDRSRAGSIYEANTSPKENIKREPCYRDLVVKLYGSDVLVNIATAGFWVRVPQKEVRFVASSGFQCCSSVMGKNLAGDLCMAHIPGPGIWATKEYIGGLLKKFGSGKYFLVSPERTYLPGADKEDVELANQENEGFRKIAEQHNLSFLRYPEIFPDKLSPQPDVWQDFTMVLTADGLQLMQGKRDIYPNKHLHPEVSLEDRIYNRILAEKPLCDVDF